MELFKPRCYKKNLLFLAGSLWLIAGFMVAKLGAEVILTSSSNMFISAVITAITFYIFFNFIFKKLVIKHRDRIRAKSQDKLCLFSFFDIKSYIIMAFMMGLGITIRSIPTINPLCWAAVYVGIGGALFLAGAYFIKEWKDWA